ncbi:hypothetical protein CXF81_01260 [Glaciecola sp. 33A]|nr:hypothetical protein CXF81_01260 [Glaciecola sp. 33A]
MMSTSAWRGSPMKLFMLFCLFIISVFLLILRTIWLYNPPFMWFVYQFAHLMLFGLCIWVFSAHHKYSMFFIVVFTALIAFMPYQITYQMVFQFDPALLSNLTEGAHIFLRLLYEFGSYPFLQFVLLMLARKCIPTTQ